MRSLKHLWAAVCILSCGILLAAYCTTDKPSESNDDPLCTASCLEPEDGDTIYTIDQVLRWDCTSWLSYGQHFDLYLDNDPANNTRHSGNIYADTLAVSNLTPGRDYYWHVVSKKDGSDSVVSDIWSFYTAANGMPTDPSPADGAIDVTLETDLSWDIYNPGGGSYTYDIYYDYFYNTDPDATALNETDYDPGTLPNYREVQWKVAAISSENDTVFGPLWRFTTANSGVTEKIFAVFDVNREAMGPSYAYEEIIARFDTDYAPDASVTPLQAGGVAFRNMAGDTSYTLNWFSAIQSHYHFETSEPFISPGVNYRLVVSAAVDVPSFTTDFTFLAVIPIITSPQGLETVSIEGFNVTWNGTSADNVTLAIYSGTEPTGVEVETINDGSYTFTANDMLPLGGVEGNYDIAIILTGEVNIVDSNLDSRSLIRMKAFNKAYSVYILNP